METISEEKGIAFPFPLFDEILNQQLIYISAHHFPRP